MVPTQFQESIFPPEPVQKFSLRNIFDFESVTKQPIGKTDIGLGTDHFNGEFQFALGCKFDIDYRSFPAQEKQKKAIQDAVHLKKLKKFISRHNNRYSSEIFQPVFRFGIQIFNETTKIC